ncbi:MAG: hypothetical protein ACOZB0_03530 [Pseudomonadota bacterium]
MKLLNARKKLVTLAVATAISGGVMMSAPAQAMNVSQNNVGQVLLFPYYTVKNGFDTVFTVTNTTDKTAIFKIRFREALNSREVLDFNVIMSPYDHWSAAVTKDAAGTGAVVRTFDNTCTSPDKPKWNATGTGGYEAPFFTDLFSNQYTDGATTDVTRVQEGYFEVILMGVSTDDVTDSANIIAYNAKHVGGVPRNCATVDSALETSATITAATDNTGDGYFTGPENILKGHVTYIDVASGKAVDAEPTAIEEWIEIGSNHIIAPANDVNPTLASGTPNTAVWGFNNGQVAGDGAGDAVVVDQVSGLLMANAVINEYATGTGAATSWVLTFPTKHFYTDAYTSAVTTSGTEGIDPFAEWFYKGSASGTGMSCDTIQVSYVNREEGPDETPSGTGFSGRGGSITAPTEICYEVNVLDFNGTSVFGSAANRTAISTASAGSAGWASVDLTIATDGGENLMVGTTTFTGLPVIGFAAVMRDAGSSVANYGSNIAHTIESGMPVITP